MNFSSSRSFRKEATCPPANKLVTYSSEELSYNEMKYVRCHLYSCDFCSAELLLLTRHPSRTEEIVTPVMPGHLRLLAKALLTGRRATAEAFTEMAAYEISA